MIRREDIADLIEGDIVEVTFYRHPNPEITVRGRLGRPREGFYAAHDATSKALNILGVTVDEKSVVVRRSDGSPSNYASNRSLVVVARAPRPKPPVYTNSDRTEYAVGDIVTYPFEFAPTGMSGPYICKAVDSGRPVWHSVMRAGVDTGPQVNASRLVLLVDGTKNEAVTK